MSSQLNKHLSPLIGGGNTVFDQDVLRFLTGEKLECESWLASVVLNNLFKYKITKSKLQELIEEEVHVEHDATYELFMLSNNAFTVSMIYFVMIICSYFYFRTSFANPERSLFVAHSFLLLISLTSSSTKSHLL